MSRAAVFDYDINCWRTAIGVLPHTEVLRIAEQLEKNTELQKLNNTLSNPQNLSLIMNIANDTMGDLYNQELWYKTITERGSTTRSRVWIADLIAAQTPETIVGGSK